jgi:three-Cys-motif partner protein
MADNNFFTEQTEQSEAKARIVQKYFWAWAKVMITQKHVERIAYIDLFAGPGRYKSGTLSTPLLILTEALKDPALCEALVTIFNDQDKSSSSSLEAAIKSLDGIDKLQHQPKVYTSEVGTEIAEMFETDHLVPTFFFVDPWGYKGLSLRLINSVLKDWGCDCVFFFNYNRISMGVNNTIVQEHMESLFEKEQLEQLRKEIEGVNPVLREQMIVEGICQSIKSYGTRYVLPFCFKDARGTRTSHHLFFVTKHFRGYEIMKEIMAKESTDQEQGVPSFTYNPADKLPKQALLFQLSRPLEDLRDMLAETFHGSTLSMQEVYEKHNVDTPYIRKNYKTVLLEMEADGLISVSDPENKTRRKGTLADRLLITFLSNEGRPNG